MPAHRAPCSWATSALFRVLKLVIMEKEGYDRQLVNSGKQLRFPG